VKRRLILSFVSALALTVLAAVCLRGAASLEQRQALESATSLLGASSRAIEAELNLRGRTLAELSAKLAADPALPTELQTIGDRADHRISPMRGVRPDLDSTTLMNAEGVVVGTTAPHRHVGENLAAHRAAAGDEIPGQSLPPSTPARLDAVLAGYPARGVSFADGVIYHWGSAPIHANDKIVGAVLIERRLASLPPVPGCDAFLVVGGKVVLGTAREGWRKFLTGGSEGPFRLGDGSVWAQRFQVPGSAAPVGFVTVDLAPRFAELAGFKHTLVALVILAWLAHLAMLLWASRPTRVPSGLPGMPSSRGGFASVLLERANQLLRAGRQRLGAPTRDVPATVVGPPAQLEERSDVDRTPPLGERVLPEALKGAPPTAAPASVLPVALPPPLSGPADGVAPMVADTSDEEDWNEATSAMPMTPELMAELGLREPPDAGLETQVMNITPEMLADLKAGELAAAAKAAPDAESAEAKAEPAGEAAEPKAEAAAASETGEPKAEPAASESAESKSESKAAPAGEAAAAKAAPVGEGAGPTTEPPDPIYHELYKRFITMRKMCGQAGDPGFETFTKIVAKSQADMMAKHSCQRVRFHVIVKGGKAIITATPLH
jgi:hypothetical protein